MYYSDTIAAISTPLGCGGIGVIRLSGPEAVKTADKLFKPSKKISLSKAATHTLHHGWISNAGVVIDEAMVSVMRAPHSYTGEDVVEISAHGGPVTLNRILKLCLENGARISRPGEFTFRAFINKKLDLTKAEAVAGLIASRTELAAKAAAGQLSGLLSEKIEAWRAGLIALAAKFEVKLDYAEENISFISSKQALTELRGLIKALDKLTATFEKGRLLAEGLKVTITGKPNTGKSSLMNALLERERAIVTEVPGTTRDVLEEVLDIKGLPVLISDTAGLRKKTSDKVEKIGHSRAIEAVKRADLILWLIDSSQKLSKEDGFIDGLIKSFGAQRKTLILLNKSDLRAKTNRQKVKKLFKGYKNILEVSALAGKGIPALEKALFSYAHAGPVASNEPILTSYRHYETLANAKKALQEAAEAVSEGHSEDITAFHVREALNYLGEITGETATEEILDAVFSKFCVGK